MTSNFYIYLAKERVDYEPCFEVMRELRPHLEDLESFCDQMVRQSEQGYRLEYAVHEGDVVGLVGYRTTENTIYGKFVYVDDLVVTGALRGAGVGATLLESARTFARSTGCAHFVLDTGLHMAEAQKFYYRNNMLGRGMHFVEVLRSSNR